MAKGDRHWAVVQRNLVVDLIKQGKHIARLRTRPEFPTA